MPASTVGTHSIINLPTPSNTSVYFKCAESRRANGRVCCRFVLHRGLLLCANLYSADWLDGRSTWPTYAYERVFMNAFMSDEGLKLSNSGAIRCNTKSKFNSFTLVSIIRKKLQVFLKRQISNECPESRPYSHQDNRSWTENSISLKKKKKQLIVN